MLEIKSAEIKTVTSLEVAEMVGKEHKTLMRDIRKYNEYFNENKIVPVDFWLESSYADSKGESRPCYNITKKGCEFIAHKLTGAKGTTFTAKYINRFHEMEDAIRGEQINTSELSESLQAFQQIFLSMAKQEMETKRLTIEVKKANDTAEKAFKVTESIKEAVQPVTDNWREKINIKFNRIQKCTDIPFSYLRNEMYQILEQRAGCDLGTRLRNKRQRMKDSGCTKTQIDKINKMDIIEEDKRLRQIFTTIVTEYEIKYCACEVGV